MEGCACSWFVRALFMPRAHGCCHSWLCAISRLSTMRAQQGRWGARKVIKKLGIGCGGLLLLAIVVALLSGGARTPTTVTPGGSGAPVTTSAAQAKVGDKVRSGNWEYTVTKIDTQKTVTWSQFG